VTKLRDLVVVQKGKKPPQVFNSPSEGATPLLLTSSLRGVKPDAFCLPFQGQVLASASDVIMAWDGTIGVTACGLQGTVGSTLAALRIQDPAALDARFLWHFLRTKEKEIRSNPRGSSIPHVNPDLLLGFDLPVPSVEIQLAIVARLDAIDEMTARYRDELKLVKGIESNLFDTQLGDSEWDLLLQDIADVQIGPFGSLLHASDYVTGGIPVLNPTHIQDGVLVADPKLTVTEAMATSLSKYRVQTGDVLLGRRGEMGRAGIVTPELNGAICGTGSVIVRPREVSPIWLRALLTSNRMKQHLVASSIGSTLPNLNGSIVQQSPAPNLNASGQKHFETQVSELTNQISLLMSAQALTEELFLSVQGNWSEFLHD
jgi:type I restriction enzyme, S subunit